MSNLQAALGVAQLERLDEFVERKRSMGRLYTSLLSGVAGIAAASREGGLRGKYLLGVWLAAGGRDCL